MWFKNGPLNRKNTYIDVMTRKFFYIMLPFYSNPIDSLIKVTEIELNNCKKGFLCRSKAFLLCYWEINEIMKRNKTLLRKYRTG